MTVKILDQKFRHCGGLSFDRRVSIPGLYPVDAGSTLCLSAAMIKTVPRFVKWLLECRVPGMTAPALGFAPGVGPCRGPLHRIFL